MSGAGADVREFVVGEPYFLVGYLDDQLVYPTIETYVFLGQDLLTKDQEDPRWYFQQAIAFHEHGAPAQLTGRDNQDLLIAAADHVEGFLDKDGLLSFVKEYCSHKC